MGDESSPTISQRRAERQQHPCSAAAPRPPSIARLALPKSGSAISVRGPSKVSPLVAQKLAVYGDPLYTGSKQLKDGKHQLNLPRVEVKELCGDSFRQFRAQHLLTADLARTRAYLHDSDSDDDEGGRVATPLRRSARAGHGRVESRESPYCGPPPVSHFSALSEGRRQRKMVANRREQLAEEAAEVEVLFAQAKKHEEIGRKIRSVLTKIENTGADLESAVGPAYSDTQIIQTMNANMDTLLMAIEQMQAPLEGKGDEEKIIREGPEAVGLQSYMASLRRVEARFNQMNNTPMRVNQDAQRDLSNLLRLGANKLQQLFDVRVQEDSRPVEPLQYTTKNAPFPQIPGPRVAELRELNAFITTTQPRAGTGLPTIQTYSNVRGKYLATTLQNMATGSKDIPKKKSENDLYRQGESTINIYAQGIEGSFKAEWNNICNVFNRDQTGIIFELTTEKALNDYSKVIRDLNSQIKINITNDCFLAYEIIDVTNALAIQLDSVTGQLKQQVREVYKPIRDTAKNALVELIEDVRRRVNGMATLPPDGAAVGYTKEVLARLQNLMNFRDSVGSSMVSLGDHGWLSGQQNNTSRPLDVNPNRDELLANYIFDTLETLFSSLEARGNTLYKNRSLMGIFLANNVATAERMIRTSDLVAFVQHSPEKTAKLEGWRKKGVSAYVDAWREPSAVLRDVQYTSRAAPRPTSGAVVDSSSIVKALSSKEKDGYKEKFKMFNNSFDMLSAKHKELVPSMDRDIKTATAREIGAMVEPMYGRFWDRYHEIDKGKGKYVRWDKAGLAREIMQLG